MYFINYIHIYLKNLASFVETKELLDMPIEDLMKHLKQPCKVVIGC